MCQGIDAFELWCWRRLLRISWTAERSNQSILKKISPECSLERLILKLKLYNSLTWCEELTHLKRPWSQEILKAKERNDRGWDGWNASLTQWIWASSESWAIKKAEHWRIDGFELWCWRRLLRVPWTVGRSNQSILKGNQSWIFIGRTDAEAETPILWPPNMKNWLNGKDPDAGKDWDHEEKGTTEDEMVGWHHWLMYMSLNNVWKLVMDSMECCSPWGCKELDTTEQLNWTELSANDNLSILVELQFLHHLLPLSWKKKNHLEQQEYCHRWQMKIVRSYYWLFYSMNMALKIKHYKGNPV